MADYSPTIIAASLNDKELEASIKSLVSTVKTQTETMAGYMDTAVARMKASLQSLGNISVDMGGSADGGSSRRAKKQVEEKQAVDATTVSYQNLEAAKQKAIGSSPAQDSYQEFVKNMRQNVALLAMEIKDMPNWSLDRQFGNYMQYERQIEQVRHRIQELKQELQNVGSDPNSSRLVIKQITEQIAQEQQKLVQLQKEQITTTKQIELADKQALAQKQAQYETEKKALVDMSVGQRERISFGERQIAQEAKITDEIRRQADEIRKSAEWKKYGTYQVYDKETNSTYQVAKGAELSLEEQILNIQKEKNKQIYQEEAEQQKQNSSLAETLNIERQITEEQGKRKKYISPTISTEMNAQSYLRFASERAGGQLLSYDELTSSSKRLGAALKQQQAIYASLTEEERQHPYGQTTLVNIQSLQRAISKLNSQMSRPISLEAAKLLPTKTLDDISYKIQMLQRYRSGIDITKPNASKEIDSVNKSITELTNKQRTLLGTNKSLFESNNALARSWNYMKNRLAFYFTVGASTAFVKNLIEVRSQYEMNERALGILINSAERGTQIFKELSEMALVSPYTLIELSSATKQLVAYGVAAKDAVDTTRRLADMAAAVGIPMERLTYALGQIKAYGYLNSRDQRMFANAGIPLVQELAKHYTELEGRLVTSADVYDRIKKKAVDYGDVVQVINKMTDEGGKFFDYQAKMAETLKVQLANLTLAWNNMLNEIGADTQGMISFGIRGLKQLFLHWRTLDEAIKNAAWTLGLFKAYQAVILLSAGALKTVAGWYALVGKRITDVTIAAWKAGVALATNPVTWITAGVFAFVSLVRHINQVTEAAREMNRELAKNAKEAADSLDKYLGSESSKTNRAAAKNKSLSELDATKAFEDLRGQIELSSDNANVLIADLLKIGDANERLSAAFDIADKIKEATSLLSGLNEEAFKVSQDNWLSIGEGLAEDLEDYVPQEFSKGGLFGKVNQRDKHEAEREMEILAKDLAQVLRDRLGASISDPIVLGEAIERFRRAIKDKNPQIKGEVAQWFDIKLDQLLAGEFDKATLATTSINKQFLTVLKRDYASAFSSVTDGILEKTAKWDKAQMDAIKKAAEELKKTTIPAWHSTIDEMVRYMNDQDWRIRIATEMGIGQRTDLQKLFDKEFADPITNTVIDKDLSLLRPKEGDDFIEYRKRINKTLDEGKKKEEDLRKQAEASRTTNKELADSLIAQADAQGKANRAAEALKNAWHLLDEEKSKSGTKKDPLGDAVQDNIKYINEIRKKYEEYKKEGLNANEALEEATKHYTKSLARVNQELSKYGIQGLTGEKLATMNLQEVRDYFQNMLNGAQSSAKAVEVLEKALENVDSEIIKFRQQTLLNSLNSELSKLKDEYELAVELDANPELGGVFADMMGLSKEELEKLPRDFEGVVRKLQTIVDNKLGMGAFDVRSNLNKDVFDKWVKSSNLAQDSDLVAKLKAITEYANKVRLDETKKQIEDWNKLLEKYAEYEYKRTQIMQEAEREREIARKKNAGSDVLNAIDLRERRELAKLDFEQFQRSPEWITATGDLATLTDKALGTLIKDLEEYKKKAKNLDPKQIKQLNDALKKLRNQQRQGNPFLAIKRAFEEAAEKAAPFNQEVKELTERWMALKRKQSQSDEGVFLTKSEHEELEELPQKIDEAQKKAKEVGKVSAQAMVAAINEMLQPINTVTGAIGDMFSAFGNTEASENIQKVTQMLDKAASFAAMGAQVGGGWGAAIGGIVGAIVGGITAWADELSGNADITSAIEQHQREVKKLQISYENLESAVNKAYGTEEYALRRVALANKEAQLAQLNRQLELEKSRSSKYYDVDRVIELEGEINTLQNEIKDGFDEITNSLLGISSVGDAVESMVEGLIGALRNGEDAMDAFNVNIDDMIANMVKKAYSSRVMGKWFDQVWEQVDNDINDRTKDTKNQLKQVEEDLAYQREKQASGEYVWAYSKGIPTYAQDLPYDYVNQTQDGYMYYWEDDKAIEIFEREKKYLQNLLNEQSAITIEDIKKYAELLREGQPVVESELAGLESLLRQLGLIKDSAEKKLSNLQQGIQGITEDTAGSIEAYLNGISQQIYLHSAQLEEIKAIMQGWDFDVSLGTMSQILLQLQSSYQVQMTIQNTLLGWSSPNGMSVRVEMV